VIVVDVERDKSMVEDLLAFKTKMDTVVNRCCIGDEARYMQIVKDAFDVFINQRTNKPAELIGASVFF
jgi:cullin-4